MRRESNPFRNKLGSWVNNPLNFGLCCDILDRLYWTKVPKPNILQVSCKDLTIFIFKQWSYEADLKTRVEIYKLLNLEYLKRHDINKKLYVVSINQKGIDFLNYQTSDNNSKIALELEWRSYYSKNEFNIKLTIEKDYDKI